MLQIFRKKYQMKSMIKVNKYQREYFLKEQLKVDSVRTWYGKEDDKTREIKKMRLRLGKMGLPELAQKAIEEEMDRLEVIPDSSPEYNVSRTYLTWMLDLPWNKETEEEINILDSKKILNRDHFS